MPRSRYSVDVITAKQLAHKVFERIGNSTLLSVQAVIGILIEEIIKDMMAHKTLKIYNFGSLFLRKLKPRYFHNFRTKTIDFTKGKFKLELELIPRLKKYLMKNIDFNKTFQKCKENEK